MIKDKDGDYFEHPDFWEEHAGAVLDKKLARDIFNDLKPYYEKNEIKLVTWVICEIEEVG